MGNDVSASASDFVSTDVVSQKFGKYSVDFSAFRVTETNQRFIKSSHLNASLVCFSYHSDDSSMEKECFDNALALRTVRHPSILKFLEAIREPWLTGIVTESVTPMEHLGTDLFPDEIVQGFHSICSALAFLHTKAELSHNSLSLRSLYVTIHGQWKLGGFELSRPLRLMSQEALNSIRQRLGDGCAVLDNEAYQFASDRPDAFDLYCLGRSGLALCDQALERLQHPKQQQQQQRHQALDQLRKLCANSLCSPSPSERPPAERVHRQAPFASHGFTRLAAFLADFSLKSEDELRQFYVSLKARLFELPEPLVARRLGRLLLGRLPLTHPLAGSYLLPYLLRPYRGDSRRGRDTLLSEAEFRRELVPYLGMVLRIRDLAVRCALLDHFPAYCHLLDWSTEGAHRSLIPELLLGLRDRNDRLVARTHAAVGALVPIVGYAALFGDKADTARRPIFADAQPRRRLLATSPAALDDASESGTRLKDLAALSDSFGTSAAAAAAAAAASSDSAVALVEAESARIASEKAAAADSGQRAASGSQSPLDSPALSGDADAWGDADWGSDAEAAPPPPSPPPPPPLPPPPPAARPSGGGGLTVEALTIRPLVTAAGRQIDEFLAELEPNFSPTTARNPASATANLAPSLRHSTAASGAGEGEGEGEADGGWSDGGDDLGFGIGEGDGNRIGEGEKANSEKTTAE